MAKTIVGFGELLWDNLPGGRRIGGAPGNFTFHARQCGLNSTLVSAVGRDEAGSELLLKARKRGLNMIVTRRDEPTGSVDVTLDEKGVPQYDIHEKVAWDYISITPELEGLAAKADAICFGSLVQRRKLSRRALRYFLSLMPVNAWKVFDINLRAPFFDKEIVTESLELCNILKLNEDEARLLPSMLGLKNSGREAVCREIQETYGLQMVILTCGAEYSEVFAGEKQSKILTPKVKIADTVGAGDSFTATFIAALMQGASIAAAHRLAVDVSAYVCTKKGAMPYWPQELKDELHHII